MSNTKLQEISGINCDFVIQSYNQFLDNIKHILEVYDFHYQIKNDILINLLIKDVKLEQTSLTYIQSLQQRRNNYTIKAQISCQLQFTQIKTSKQKLFNFNDFYIDIPVMTQSQIDPTINMTDREKWNTGNDLSQVGADLVFNGSPYFVLNTFQYPMNKPIYAPSDQYPVLAFANYLYQQDIMFGNSYYTRYDLIDGYDIALYFKQTNSLTKINYIPFMLLFKAFGCKTDQEALQYCNPNNDPQLSGYYHKQYYTSSKITSEEAYQIISQLIMVNKKDNSKPIIDQYISSSSAYLYTLGEIIRNLYYCYTTNTYSNREALVNKRVFTIAQQIISQLRGAIRTGFMQSMYSLSKSNITFQNLDTQKEHLQNILLNMSRITSNTLSKSFVNSNFDTIAPLQKTFNEPKTYVFDIMKKRQIVIRAATMAGELSKNQRMMQQDFYGFLCPIQTPESGASTGKYNSPCIYSQVTIIEDPSNIIDYITNHKLFLKSYKKYTMPIKVNYTTIGFVQWDKFKQLYNDLMKYRSTYTSVYYSIETQELCVNTDAGRIMTPIIKSTVKSFKQYQLPSLIESKKVIFIDVDMMKNFIVKEFTDPSSTEYRSEYKFLPQGIIAEFPATSPFVGTLKSLRALYSTSQMRQNIALPYTNPMNQYTNQQLTLNCPQQSVITTQFDRENFSSKPSLQLIYLIFKAATFNQEDALVANEGYFYRNGSSTSSYKTYYQQIDDYNKIESFLNTTGLQIKQNDTLISLLNTQLNTHTTLKYNEAYDSKYTQISSKLKSKSQDYLIQIQLSRYPTTGDKFVSRNAQKGTIGQILPEYLMPINEIGIVPTFIQNPDSVLRRETYGQIIEPVMGRYLAETQSLITTYGHDDYDLDLLEKLSKMPQEQIYLPNLYNMDVEIKDKTMTLGGPMMYGVQKHLVAQKMYAVNKAQLQKAIRQPAAGRRRKGGIRLGNMEQSALYAQGCTKIIKDMNGVNSSNVNWYICKRCGTNHVYPLEFIDENQLHYSYYCQFCGHINDVIKQGFSYQQSLLQEILTSIGLQLQYK